MNITAARAVLMRHGIDPAVDVDRLTAAIEARGWRIRLEQTAPPGGTGRPRRWQVLATPEPAELRPTTLAGGGADLQASGPRAENVLVRVLAQVLEREA